ncbi:MAG: hypothetical protein JJ877_14345 [Thalassococcus sp.]|uniref:hypothetical protein n=1 Tax=Thalassococcus sp. TaxID=1928858 RepID=UPI001B08CBBC|nr:hypothetical protein [Thalassococcus sp.]MBO6868220.1 hypothetical protein [Thalassococcus sp.]
MTVVKTQISDVTYNAAEQAFEAMVTFHTGTGITRVPSRFEASLDTDFEAATKGLMAAARENLNRRDALMSRIVETGIRSSRATERKLTGIQRWFGHFLGQAA